MLSYVDLICFFFFFWLFCLCTNESNKICRHKTESLLLLCIEIISYHLFVVREEYVGLDLDGSRNVSACVIANWRFWEVGICYGEIWTHRQIAFSIGVMCVPENMLFFSIAII